MPARDLRDAETQPITTTPLVTPETGLQRTAVELVLADWEAAKTARQERKYGTTSRGETLTFDTWMKELRDLYFGQRLPKTVPWRFSSNRSLMIGMAILEVLHARIFPAVYNEDLTRWRPVELNDADRADRVEKFMFWWVRVHAKLREFFDRWVRYTVGFGSAVTVSSWEVHTLDKGEQTQPTMSVNPDGSVTQTQPERILDVWETSRSDIIPLEDVFLQPGASDIQRDTVIIRRKYLYRDLEEMERDGKVVNITQPISQGIQTLKEHLIVPVPSGEGLDPQQMEELKNVRRRNVIVECLEWYGGIDLDGDTYPEQMRLLVVPQYKTYLGGIEISEMSKRGLRHLDLTMYVTRLDEPQGLNGMGVLEQVKELALEIDAIFNQMTDANSLSVMRPGFYDPSGDLDPAALSLAPNKMTPVSRPQENVYFPDFSIRTEQLQLAIKMVMDFIERLTSAGTVIYGQEPQVYGGSGTATRTQAIVTASNQRHAIPVERLREGAARIMSQHLDLVQVNLPPNLERRVLGEQGEQLFQAGELTDEGLAGEFDAYLLPDESLGSKEAERQLAQLLYTLLSQNLIVASDPTKLYKITADLLKAWGKDPELYLGVAPDVKQTDRPEDENTLILQGNFAQVKASVLDNPTEHLMTHEALPQSPVFQALPPPLQAQILQFLQGHIQEHIQVMQLMFAAGAKAKGGGGNNGAQFPGTTRGGARATAPVGSEPGVDAVQNPRTEARRVQGLGESQTPA